MYAVLWGREDQILNPIWSNYEAMIAESTYSTLYRAEHRGPGWIVK